MRLFKIVLQLTFTLASTQLKATLLEIDFSQVHAAQYPNNKVKTNSIPTDYLLLSKENYTAQNKIRLYMAFLRMAAPLPFQIFYTTFS